MAPKKKATGTKSGQKGLGPRRRRLVYRRPAGAIADPTSGFPGYDPNLWVICRTLDKAGIAALLAEFKNSNQKFKVLMVKGSPFVSLSISPTRGGND